MPVYGSDDRWYRNIFVGGAEEGRSYGTALYNGAPVSMEEYTERYHSLGRGDVEQFAQVKQPAYIDGNVYLNGAGHFDREEVFCEDAMNPEVKVTREEGAVYLEITLPRESLELPGEVISTEKLGMPRIVEQRYENPDGSAIRLEEDMAGRGRGGHPAPGPLEGLREGYNKVKIWMHVR